MILHGQIQKVTFNPPKEGGKDLAGNPDRGLYQVAWTDASRPAEFRTVGTFISWAGPDAIEALTKAAKTTDLTDQPISIAASLFKIDKAGGLSVKGAIFIGHLSGADAEKAKRGTLPPTAKAS